MLRAETGRTHGELHDLLQVAQLQALQGLCVSGCGLLTLLRKGLLQMRQLLRTLCCLQAQRRHLATQLCCLHHIIRSAAHNSSNRTPDSRAGAHTSPCSLHSAATKTA